MNERTLSPLVLETLLRIGVSSLPLPILDTPAAKRSLALLEDKGVIQRKTKDTKARADLDKTLTDLNKARADYNKAWADYNRARADLDKVRADYNKAEAEVERINAIDVNGCSFTITSKGLVFLNTILSTPWPMMDCVWPPTEQ